MALAPTNILFVFSLVMINTAVNVATRAATTDTTSREH